MSVEDICDEMFDGYGLANDNGCHGCSYALGAAVAFGLMGMAEAIRDRDAILATLHHWRKYSEAYDRHWRDNSRSTTGEGGE